MKFQEALDHFGSQSAIAKAVGLDVRTVWAWKSSDRIPHGWQFELEEVSAGALRAQRLRPSVAQGMTQAR